VLAATPFAGTQEQGAPATEAPAPAPEAPPADAPAPPPADAPPPGEVAPAGAPPAEVPPPAPEAPVEPAPQPTGFPAQPPAEAPPVEQAPAGPQDAEDEDDLTPQERAQREIAAAKEARQSTDPAAQQAAMAAMDCTKQDPLAGNDDPQLPLVTCSQDGTEVYLLDASRIDGQEIKDAVSNFNTQQSRWVVNLEFKSSGADAWADLTGE